MLKNRTEKIFFCIFGTCAVIIAYVLLNKHMYNVKSQYVLYASDSNKYVYDVETSDKINEIIQLEGWFFLAEEVRGKTVDTSENYACSLVLVDVSELNGDDDGRRIKGIPSLIKKNKREDINLYYNCEYDYSDCGYIAYFNAESIRNDIVYRVFFKTDDRKNKAVASNVYLLNGKVYRVDPRMLGKLNVSETDLNELVKEGTILVAKPDVGIYVVQHDGKMYWIADENAVFDGNGATCMEYQFDTTQLSKLPQNRLERGWYWSNLSDSFEKYEITNTMNCGKYRVMVRDIPTDYPITHIELGYHDGEKWIWKEEIKPVYKGELIP